MSVQEQKLTAIANAIREKDGTTEPIPANDFPDRILAIQGGGGIELASIAITAPPDKRVYTTGDLFDPTGMVVQATYSNGATLIATGWAVEPAGPLPEGLEAVTVRYTEGGVSATASQPIEVRSMTYLYGFDINNADSNPATRVSYPADVDNHEFAAAKMNFNSDTFSYGDWPNVPGEKFMPRPCMLKFDGTVAYYLDPDDYTKKEDGTASDVANISFGGNAMMEWPKIFTKRWESGGVYHFRCSDVQVDEDYECWCNYDRLNNEVPHFYTPIFFGSKDSSDRLRSVSNQNNLVARTAQTEVTYAKANGDDWYTEVAVDVLLLQDLLVMIFKSTDLQLKAGYGRCKSSNSNSIATGTMNTKGLFWGADDKVSGVKVFGMENVWGNMWRRTAGLLNVSNRLKAKITRGSKDGSTAADYNFDGVGYIEVFTPPAGSGYISEMRVEQFGRLATAFSGSATTFETDSGWYDGSGIKYLLVGGAWPEELQAGPYCLSFRYGTGENAAYIGAAPSCKPLASIQAQS